MELGPIPEYLKPVMRKRFLAGLKNSHSLDTYELDLFRWFRTETEATWAQMDSEERQYIQEQVDSGVEEVNDSGILATDYYRKRMRTSNIIFLASLLESAMKRECERVCLALGDDILFKPSDLKGDPWVIRKVFLEKYGSFQIPDNLWDPIKKLLALRNAFAHHNGEVSLLTKEQILNFSKITGVDLSSSDISIHVSYIDSVSDSVHEIMEFLHEKINLVIDRAMSQKTVPAGAV